MREVAISDLKSELHPRQWVDRSRAAYEHGQLNRFFESHPLPVGGIREAGGLPSL